MERQSTSKLYRALIAVVAFFVLCTSAILFASCGTDPRECKHEHLDDSDVVAVELATCGTPGTVTYECSDCGAEVTQIGTLATGEHTWANGKCTVCGVAEGSQGLTLKQVQDALATLTTKVDSQASVFVQALQDPNVTIPALDKKLETILASVQDFGDLDIEGFDASEFEFLAETGTTGKVTLTDVITALYKQVHQLYVDYASTAKDANLYDLLVSTDGSHVHNWVLQVKGDIKDCSKGVTYEWGCAFCDAKKEGEVTVKAIGHATDYKFGLNADGTPTKDAVDGGHYYAATCIAPARVEGHCAVCGQWTGEWNPVGEPTYKHNYVLETPDHSTGSVGDCTHVHENVYHCATCGGAYVEEVAAPGHNYYYKMENGKKVALSDAEKDEILEDYYGETKFNAGLTEEEKGLALQPYLNIVYSADATCVDPGLVVVECVECGVRYSYTTDEGPKGHHFFGTTQVDETCTMDGIAGYAYCDVCGYFFFYDGGHTTDEMEPGTDDGYISNAVGAHSRNYIRKDGKVIHYVSSTTVTAAPEAKAQDTAKTVPQALVDLYDVVTSTLPAPGHSYVPVYLNVKNCVTAQQYILVCEKCYTGFSTAFDTEKNGVKGHWVKDLTGNPLTDPNVAKTAVENIGKAATHDDPTTGDSDLTKEWKALTGTGSTATEQEIFAWLAAHGYLVREENDNGPIPSLTRNYVLNGDKTNKIEPWYDDNGKLTKAALEEIDGYLAALKKANPDTDIKVLLQSFYTPCNVLGTWVKKAGTVEAHCTPAQFADLVDGHTFKDSIVTVVDNCVMYERHVFFCSVCGSGVKKDTSSTDPHIVEGVDDVVCAGYDGTTIQAPAGFKTDLQKEWEAVKEAALVDIDALDPFLWLAQHGYVNDLRDEDNLNKEITVEPTYDAKDAITAYPEISDLMVRAGMIKLGKSLMESQQLSQTDLDKLFTGENVLSELEMNVAFEGTNVWLLGVDDNNGGFVGDPVTGNYTFPAVELGHTFDAVAYIGQGEKCDEPANYVYVCSKCGLKTGAKTTDFTIQSGTEQVKTKVGFVADPNYVSDSKAFEAAAPASRRGDGKDFPKSDLELEWEAAEDKFEWLLNKGYLNGVIDSLMLFGYGEGDAHVEGALEKAMKDETVNKSKDGWLQKLYAVDATATASASGVFYEFYDKVGSTYTLKKDVKSEIKTHAEAIAKAYGYTTGTDLEKFYKQSGDKAAANGTDTITGKAANKTSEAAKVFIPESGHVYYYGNGKIMNLATDPRCFEFKDAALTQKFKEGKIVRWDASANSNRGGWVEETETFKYDDLSDEVKNAVEKFGVVAACYRPYSSCPFKYDAKKNPKEYTVDDNPYGYVIATDHVESYEKYTAGQTGIPTGTVETVNDGEHVYYNYKEQKDYTTKEIASQYLANPTTWDTLLTLALKDTTSATAAEKAQIEDAQKQITDAAQAAMNADLYNLETLQHIWNTLFVDLDWLYPTITTTTTTGTTTTSIDWATAEERMAAYPFYNVEGYVTKETVTTTDTDGTTHDHVHYTAINFEAIKALFDADNKVPELWKDVNGQRVSAWRPLGDEIKDGRNVLSCWVDLRCKWFHVKDERLGLDGTKCTKGSVAGPKHIYPTDGKWYGYESHVANCRHNDYCMTCGKMIGREGTHALIEITQSGISDPDYRAAWISVLKAAKAYTSSTTADKTPVGALLKKVQNAVEFTEGVEFTDNNFWTAGWKFKVDTCVGSDASETGVTDENGYRFWMCTGELEIIAESGDAWQTETTLKLVPATVTLGTDSESKETVTFAGTGVNWAYKEINNKAHGWAKKGNAEHTRTEYYYLQDYVLDSDGSVVGEAGKPIYAKDGAIVPAGTEGALPITDVNGNTDALKYSEVVCSVGYYTRTFCTEKKQDGTECGCVDPEHDGADASKTVARHGATGHYYAPQENYDDLLAPNYVPVPADKSANAYVAQVCVKCGTRRSSVWGVITDADGREQCFSVDSQAMIDEWNAHVDATPNSNLVKAELIKPKDLAEGTTTDGLKLKDQKGMIAIKEDATITLSSTADDNVIEHEVTIYVGAGTKDNPTTLTFAEDTTNDVLTVKNTLAIVGEVDAEGNYLSEVDFSALSDIRVDGGDLILKDIKITMGSDSINPGPGLGGTANGGVIEMTNVYITSSGSVFGMNANDNAEGKENVITIKNSTLVSTGDFALAIWKKSAKVEASDSTFVGAWGGAFIRSGSAVFTNCTFGVAKTGTAYSGSDWGDGSNVTTRAALVVGNKTSQEERGNADVKLTNCTFGAYESFTKKEDIKVANLGTSLPAIDVYSSDKNVTTLTIDAKSENAANAFIKTTAGEDENGKSTLTIIREVAESDLLDSQGKYSATAAGTLLEKAVAVGGEIDFSKVNGAVTITDAALSVAKEKDVTVKLGSNQQLTLGKGAKVEGSLTVTGGTVVATKDAGNSGIVVSKASDGTTAGSLTLNNTEVSFGKDTVYGIYAKDGATVNVNNSLVYSTTGMTLATNADDTESATFVLINSAFINDSSKTAAEADGGELAALVNNKNAEIYAGGCTFYGTNGALWLRAAKTAVFAGCTFISGGAASANTSWGAGTTLPNNVLAAVVIGNGSGNAYGTVEAKITDCQVYFSGSTSTKGKPQSAPVDKYTWDDEDGLVQGEGTVPGWTYAAPVVATVSAVSNTKLFTVAALGAVTDGATTKVTFSDKDTAQAFIPTLALKEGETAIFTTPATRDNFDVKYVTSEAGAETTTYASIGIDAELDSTTLATEAGKATIVDTWKNGGKVTLPEAEEGAAAITLPTMNNGTGKEQDHLRVEAGKSVELDLNGNTVQLPENKVAVVNEGSSLKITGGTLKSTGSDPINGASLVQVQGNNAVVDIENTKIESTGSYAFGIANGNLKGVHVTIKNSTLKAACGWSVNGQTTESVIEMEKCNVLGDTIGAYLAGNTTTTITNSLLYGSVAAVEVSGGNVTFDGCTFMSAGFYFTTGGTYFSNGGYGFPTGTTEATNLRASVVINSKVKYPKPVEVTFKGTTKWLNATGATEQAYKLSDMFVTESSGEKTTELIGVNGEKLGFYKSNDQGRKVSVAVVLGEHEAIEAARVKITTNTELGLRYNTNVLVYSTMGDAQTAATLNSELELESRKKLVTMTGSNTIADPE